MQSPAAEKQEGCRAGKQAINFFPIPNKQGCMHQSGTSSLVNNENRAPSIAFALTADCVGVCGFSHFRPAGKP